MERSFCGLPGGRLSDQPVLVFHCGGKLVWYGAVSGIAGGDSLCGAGFYVFRDFGGAGKHFRHLPDLGLYELFYHVCEYRYAAHKPFLPSGGGGAGSHLRHTGISYGRRGNQADSHDWGDSAAGKLRRQFRPQYIDYVFHCPGTLYAAER